MEGDWPRICQCSVPRCQNPGAPVRALSNQQCGRPGPIHQPGHRAV